MFDDEVGSGDSVEPRHPRVKVQLVGQDGNVFSIIARVSKALKQGGHEEDSNEFKAKAFKCGSYGEVLNLCSKYVSVR